MHDAAATTVMQLVRLRTREGLPTGEDGLPLFIDVVLASHTDGPDAEDNTVSILLSLHHAHCDGVAASALVSAFCGHMDAVECCVPPSDAFPVDGMSPPAECLVELRPTLRVVTMGARLPSATRALTTPTHTHSTLGVARFIDVST